MSKQYFHVLWGSYHHKNIIVSN